MSSAPAARRHPAPRIALAIVAHDRPLRLRWILNSLEEQVAPARWEALLALRCLPRERELIADHPLIRAGTARLIEVAPETSTTAAFNALWRAARAPSIAFLDAEVRLPGDWLARACRAVNDTDVIEGSIQPDPLEATLLRSVLRDVRSSTPPATFPSTANLIFPKSLLERLEGVDESVAPLELAFIDLAARAKRAGSPWRPHPELVVYSSVRSRADKRQLRLMRVKCGLPAIVRRHPELRAELPLGFLVRRSHGAMALAMVGVLGMRHRRTAMLFAIPWLAGTAARTDPAGLANALPRRAVEDCIELILLTCGSLRHRCLLV